MRAMWLIAANLLREQRWPLLILLLWVFGSSVISGLGSERPAPEDVLFFVKTQAVYGVAFTAFMAASAIHNERKSRRILSVLSKGIHRAQYIGGLLEGVLVASAGYCLAMGVTGGVLFVEAGLPEKQLWSVLAMLMTALVVTATLAMLFSTFLGPLLATAATALALGTPALAARVAGGRWSHVLPVYFLMNGIMDFSVKSTGGWEPIWTMVAWSMVDAAVLLMIASWIFSRRDIAVALE